MVEFLLQRDGNGALLGVLNPTLQAELQRMRYRHPERQSTPALTQIVKTTEDSRFKYLPGTWKNSSFAKETASLFTTY